MIGWDMGAAMQMADALGYCRFAVAEILPVLEAIRVKKFNEVLERSDGAEAGFDPFGGR
jgi:hypothetical protein